MVKNKSQKSETKKSSDQKQEKSVNEEVLADAESLKKAFEEIQVKEFIKYLRSPWRIMWHNFLAGVFRGLGLIVGMTAVFAILIWMLTQLVDFPLIGQYFEDLKNILENFSEIETR